MNVTQIGEVDWDRTDLLNMLSEFLELYKDRPIQKNEKGMMSPHMFACYFVAKRLRPKVIIESGIWKGQSTWLFEQAAPEASIYCLDPLNSDQHLKYKSMKAIYLTGQKFQDFGDVDWSEVDHDSTLCFFDDHIGIDRIKQSEYFNFRHIIFEDNYSSYGNGEMCCHPTYKSTGIDKEYSPKACLMHGLGDENYLRNVLDVYYEFPPIVKNHTSPRSLWKNISSITKPPLLDDDEISDEYRIFEQEAYTYTWICYMRLKRDV